MSALLAERTVVGAGARVTSSHPVREPDDICVYDRQSVARLSADDINRMSCSKLVRIIRACRDDVLRPEFNAQLEFADRTLLESLIFGLRRMIREQLQWERTQLSYAIF